MSANPSDPSMPTPRASTPPTRAFTLVVATTPTTNASNPSIRRLGIGHNGTLPWPRITADMGFFARVTTRPPPAPSSSPSKVIPTPTASTTSDPSDGGGVGKSIINAVIMGRKTYDSIPERFRPLPKRFNVIITRDESGAVRRRVEVDWKAARRREKEKIAEKKRAAGGQQPINGDIATGSKRTEEGSAKAGETPQEEDQRPDVLVSGSLESALRDLTSEFSASSDRRLGNIYVIGGAEIYAAALRLDPAAGYTLRLLMTDVRKRRAIDSTGADVTPTPDYDPSDEANGFKCSTFFPLELEDIEGGKLWRKADPSEVTEWVGEEVTGQWKLEGDIALRMCGYEKIGAPTQ